MSVGIYIKGMKMPQKGEYECTIRVWADGTAMLYGNSELIDGGELVSVLPHGDLIDRYDLKNKEITIDYDEWDDTFDDGLLFVTDLIDNAPAIIPADPPKEKT